MAEESSRSVLLDGYSLDDYCFNALDDHRNRPSTPGANNYDNNVSRLTANVIRGFLKDGPLP